VVFPIHTGQVLNELILGGHFFTIRNQLLGPASAGPDFTLLLLSSTLSPKKGPLVVFSIHTGLVLTELNPGGHFFTIRIRLQNPYERFSLSFL
jgi:hypothetical protein